MRLSLREFVLANDSLFNSVISPRSANWLSILISKALESDDTGRPVIVLVDVAQTAWSTFVISGVVE